MFENIIHEDGNITLFLEEDKYFIKVTQPGYSINQFNEILSLYPRIKITEYKSLNQSFTSLMNQIILIGELKPLVSISVAPNELEAKAIVNISDKEYENMGKEKLIIAILYELKKLEIVFGFNIDTISNNLLLNEPFVVATGQLPIKGENAIVTYYDMSEITYEIDTETTINYYDFSLIHKVLKGDWVGERIEPKEGIPGITVLGKEIPAPKGNQEPLLYDPTSVDKKYDEENNITTLYALRTGAVSYKNGKISINNCLSIDGNVDFETGNIDFEGFVDVANSVEDNFCIRADNNIQIRGDLGVGAVEKIETKEGDIFIKGGISGKDTAKIICNGNLHTKYAANCEILCTGIVYIEQYAVNSNITAKQVIFNSPNSKIVGGIITVESKIKVGTLGSKVEVPTKIILKGFSRDKIKEDYENAEISLDKVFDALALVKEKISKYQNSERYNIDEIEETLLALNTKYTLLNNTYTKLKQDLATCKISLSTKGDGELKITNNIYPKVFMTFRQEQIFNHDLIQSPTTYYISGTDIITI